MNPITVIYKLRLKGYSPIRIAKEMKVSKQLVNHAIWHNPKKGISKTIREKIDEILTGGPNEP